MNGQSGVDRLMKSLLAYDDTRRGEDDRRNDGRRSALAEGCCCVLAAGPLELGTQVGASALRERGKALLGDPAPGELPEAQVCRLWLSCVEHSPPSDLLDQLIALASGPLWEPVRALVARALAHHGRRDALSSLWPQAGPVSPYGDELTLEALYADGAAGPRAGYDDHTACFLNPAMVADWVALLSAEFRLATTGAEIESDIRPLIRVESLEPSCPYEESERRRIASRAAAAIVRDRIARGRDASDMLSCPAFRALPQWEKDYLSGLCGWRAEQRQEAICALRHAIHLNPDQSCVRLALSVILADEDCAMALSALGQDNSSLELLAAKAALLTRMGERGLAAGLLQKHCAGPIRLLPLRYSWVAGRRHYVELLRALRTTLCEEQGDWQTAREQWTAGRSASGEGPTRALELARAFSLAGSQLRSSPSLPESRLAELERDIRRAWHEIGTVPLFGDALFFRAAGALDRWPAHAAKDFRTLLHQRRWSDAERRVGSGRLAFVGDALMRLGCPQEAVTAYEAGRRPPAADIQERMVIARLWEIMQRSDNPAEIQAAVAEVDGAGSTGGWAHLAMALALALAGQTEEMTRHLEAAQCPQVPTSLREYAGAVCSILSGSTDRVAVPASVLKHCPPEVCLALQGFASASTSPDTARGTLMRIRTFCDQGAWDEAIASLNDVRSQDTAVVKQLRALLTLRLALTRAATDLEQATKDLQTLERSLPALPQDPQPRR